jgi:RNA polymerase sigma-70 factor (ECF subfamily)
LKRDLVEAARRGELEAFDALVRQEVGGVYRTALAILGRPADAEDATQDAFLSAWRSLPRLRDPERVDAWFGRIVVNACRMSLRRRGSVREISLDATALPDVKDRSKPDPDAQAAEADAFDRAFERLSVDDRALLVLHYRDELGLREIAHRLDVREGTLKSRMWRARRALEAALDQERQP